MRRPKDCSAKKQGQLEKASKLYCAPESSMIAPHEV